jgi:hypothetical protein
MEMAVPAARSWHICCIAKGARMKIVKVEVEVHLPDHMDDANVSNGIDHMLDAGGADMVDEVFKCAAHPVIDPAIAEDCISLTVNDSEVVSSATGQPEHDEPARKLIELSQLDEYHNPPGLDEDIEAPVVAPKPASDAMQICSVRVADSEPVAAPTA